MAAGFFAPPRIRRNLVVPQGKSRNSVAASLPQHRRMQLMFGAAVFLPPRLSASRCTGFRRAPRGIGAAAAASCGASASSNDGFRSVRSRARPHAA
jgi:hypothetical protein